MHNRDAPTNAPADEPSSLSPRQLIARRANAQKSTGPRTREGKAAVRLNSLKHGFFARDVVNAVLDGHDYAAGFTAMLDALVAHYQPDNALERMLVDEIAACCWRIRRLLRYESREAWRDEDSRRDRADVDSLLLPPATDANKIIRCEATVKRNLYRAIAYLDQAQSERNRSSGREGRW
ncbi:MAG: hypothetical protein ACREQF_13680 [Candidatus Binataceae bacterium]